MVHLLFFYGNWFSSADAQAAQPENTIVTCFKDKCCRKAFHDSGYYCDEVMSWKNDTLTPPVCSMACLNALNNLYADPLGKSIFCDGIHICGKFSEIKQNDLVVLKDAELCNRIAYNLKNFCNLSQNFECSQPAVSKEG